MTRKTNHHAPRPQFTILLSQILARFRLSTVRGAVALNPPSAGLLCTRFSQVYTEQQTCWLLGSCKAFWLTEMPRPSDTAICSSNGHGCKLQCPRPLHLGCHFFPGSIQYVSGILSFWPQCAFLSQRRTSVLSQGCQWSCCSLVTVLVRPFLSFLVVVCVFLIDLCRFFTHSVY